MGKSSTVRTAQNRSDKKKNQKTTTPFPSSLAFTFHFSNPSTSRVCFRYKAKASASQPALHQSSDPSRAVPLHAPLQPYSPKMKHSNSTQNTVSQKKKRVAADKPGGTYLVSIFLVCCQFLGVSFYHLSVLSLIQHQPKL